MFERIEAVSGERIEVVGQGSEKISDELEGIQISDELEEIQIGDVLIRGIGPTAAAIWLRPPSRSSNLGFTPPSSNLSLGPPRAPIATAIWLRPPPPLSWFRSGFLPPSSNLGLAPPRGPPPPP
ncbi:hypothetical protein TIFTF001_014148 [Ficus carica]|uniref:Uncharacterized protein n=1 Tax=Ficus carica TaxID=3494 RepID=A0AA88D3R8_FICCA|nr:hypothetical protein TIFTF001_014148 [Ficus carica]